MKNLYFIFGLLVVLSLPAQAQQSGSLVRLGFGLNYLNGGTSTEFTTDKNRLGYHIDLSVAYRFAKESGGTPVVMGFFGRGGVLPSEAIEAMFTDGGLDVPLEIENRSEFYEAQAGMVLFRSLQLSTGLGFLHYRNDEGGLDQLVYRSSTARLQINFRSVRWEIGADLLHEKDLKNNLLRFSAGLGFEF